jgi:hypothetical protein
MKYIILILSISPLLSFAQGFGDYIKKNAIEISVPDSLNEEIYNRLKKYQLIMIGEMHGTQEPARLVSGIAKLIVKFEGTVSIGLEMPEDELIEFIDNPSDSILRLTKFFSKTNIDGRNGKSWFDLILYCNSDPKINLFLFDNFKSYEIENRDSAMYLTIVRQLKRHSNSRIITLSGNIHNWLIPYKTAPTMGNYCMNDTINFSKDKICSINHVYSEGTMLNNTGNGLELTTIEFEESIYSNANDFTNYLLFFKSAKPYQYNGMLYTRIVNHSEEIEKTDNDR